MVLLMSIALAGCGDLKDWLDVNNAGLAGFEEAYPAHLDDALRYRQTALQARDIEWMVESPADWLAVEEQASLARGHAEATADGLAAMLDQVGSIGAECRKLDKHRGKLVARHGLALAAQEEASELEAQAAQALERLPTVVVELPQAYDQRIAALLDAARAVADGGGEEAAHALSALVRQLEPWELRAIQDQLPEHPVVQLTVASALANTGDMRDVNEAAKLQSRAAELVEEDLNVLPATAAGYLAVGVAKPNNGDNGGLTVSAWVTPRRRILLGAEWESQRLSELTFTHAALLGCFDLVGMEAYRPLVINTGPLVGGGWGQGKGAEGKPKGSLTAVLGWKVGVRFRPKSFLVFTVDFEARNTASAVKTPPTGMLSVGVGWSGYRPL